MSPLNEIFEKSDFGSSIRGYKRIAFENKGLEDVLSSTPVRESVNRTLKGALLPSTSQSSSLA